MYALFQPLAQPHTPLFLILMGAVIVGLSYRDMKKSGSDMKRPCLGISSIAPGVCPANSHHQSPGRQVRLQIIPAEWSRDTSYTRQLHQTADSSKINVLIVFSYQVWELYLADSQNKH